MRSGRSHTIAVLLLGVAVVLAPLRRGGVDWPVDVSVAVVACLALLMATVPLERPWMGAQLRPTVSWAEIGLLCVALVIALQMVPMPAWLIRVLSPGAHDVFRRALEPLDLYPASRPLSLDPGTTARELCKAAAWTLAFPAAVLLTRLMRGGRVLLAFVAASGAAAGILALAASLVGAGTLVESRAVFVNPNHLAGLVGLAAWPALGFALRARGATRMAWLAAFGVCSVEVFLTLSRGGIGGLAVGGTVFALLMARRESREPRPRRRTLLGPILVTGAAVSVAAVLAFSPLLATLETIRGAPFEAKLAVWPVAGQMAMDFPLVGIGRGAYLTAYPAYERDPAPFTFSHVENEWIQLPVELGLPGGLLVLATFGWLWVAAARTRALSRPLIGALAGTSALVAHNMVDFSLELSGVALPFAVTMGVLSWRRRELKAPAWVIRSAACLLLALGLTGMAVNRRHSLDRDVARVQAAKDVPQLLIAARKALEWHPADYLPPATVGARLVEAGQCREALPWLVRAMERKPTAPEPHRFAARCLSADGPDSPAGLEYRLAFLLGDRDALREAALRYPAPGALLSIAPQTVKGLVAAGDVATSPDDAVAAYQMAWELFNDPQALSRLSQVLLNLGDSERALELARTLQRTSPGDLTGYLVAGAALAKTGQLDAASAELEAGARRLPGNDQILLLLAQTYMSRHMFWEARKALEQIAVRTDRELCDKHLYLAGTMEQAGQLADAIPEYEAAHRALPPDPRSLEGLARIAGRVGRHDEELSYLQEAAALPGVDRAAYEARIARLKRELERNSDSVPAP
jgi:O-antigen ligase/tetratricopeptide (TPR) repeat protein